MQIENKQIENKQIPCPQQMECLALLGERMYGEGYTVHIQTYRHPDTCPNGINCLKKYYFPRPMLHHFPHYMIYNHNPFDSSTQKPLDLCPSGIRCFSLQGKEKWENEGHNDYNYHTTNYNHFGGVSYQGKKSRKKRKSRKRKNKT